MANIKRIGSFTQKGFSAQFLQLMKQKQQANECCENPPIDSIATENSDTVTFGGNGTVGDPLTAEAIVNTQNSPNVSFSGSGSLDDPLIATVTNEAAISYRHVSANDSILATDDVIIVDTTAGNVTLSLVAATVGSKAIWIKKLGTDINSVIISKAAGNLYADNGAQTSYTFFGPGASVVLLNENPNSYIV